MHARFGITPERFNRAGDADYTSGAGLRDVRPNASVVNAIDARWPLTGALTVAPCRNEARVSPIVFEPTAVTGVVAPSCSS